MRAALVCLVLSVVFAIGTVTYVIRDSLPHPDLVDAAPPPPPKPAEERAATRTAESFAAAVAGRDKGAACRLAADTQARDLRCDDRGKARWPACAAKRATGSETRDEGVIVYIEPCRFWLRHSADGWRVIRKIRER
jgi:hypothetical protein